MKKAITSAILLVLFSLSILSAQNKVAIVKIVMDNGQSIVYKQPVENKFDFSKIKAMKNTPINAYIDVQLTEVGSDLDRATDEKNRFQELPADAVEMTPEMVAERNRLDKLRQAEIRRKRMIEMGYMTTDEIPTSVERTPKITPEKYFPNEERIKNYRKNSRYGKRYAFIPGFWVENPDGEGLLLVRKMKRFKHIKSKLKKGDILLAVNDEAVENRRTFYRTMGKYTPDQNVTLTISRKGNRKIIENQPLAQLDFPTERKRYNYDDPCQVFVGVSHGGSPRGEGNLIGRVVENTVAEKMGLQVDDLIVEMDGLELITDSDFIEQRDSHQAGEEFTLTIFRKGKKKKLKGQFMPCKEVEQPSAEVQTPNEVDLESTAQTQQNAIEVFPNPSNGKFNLKFNLEAKPTFVKLLDSTGKEVYLKKLESFEGTFNEELNIPNLPKSTYFLMVSQEARSLTKHIVIQ